MYLPKQVVYCIVGIFLHVFLTCFALFNQMYLSKQVLHCSEGICLDLFVRDIHFLIKCIYQGKCDVLYFLGFFWKENSKLQFS